MLTAGVRSAACYKVGGQEVGDGRAKNTELQEKKPPPTMHDKALEGDELKLEMAIVQVGKKGNVIQKI